MLAVLAGEGSQYEEFILLQLRLPRALVALGAGAALAISGAISKPQPTTPWLAPILSVSPPARPLAWLPPYYFGQGSCRYRWGHLSVPVLQWL